MEREPLEIGRLPLDSKLFGRFFDVRAETFRGR
jgi:hypothetical protein